MMTFSMLLAEAQAQTEDSSTATSTLLSRAINQGCKKFGAVLSREWRVSYDTFNIVANQQFFQMPEAAIRIKSLKVLAATGSTITYPLEEIADEATWDRINQSSSNTSSVPTHYFVRGADEFGIYPEPSASITSGGTIGYERRMRDMTVADYTTGTIAITVNTAAVTGSGTTFTAQMVDRYLRANDPVGDGMWYKISAFTSTTAITLENTVTAAVAASSAYTIGEVPDIPEEYHEALVDYACYRFYRMRKDIGASRDMKAAFDEALQSCKEQYSSKTSSQYVRSLKLSRQVYNRNTYQIS